LLIQAQQAHTRPTTDQRVAEAREAFIDAAHTYSSWKLPQRFWLQARTKRLKGSVVTVPVTPRKG
jgi:hypothetical protein